jgi:hypothetical protein
MIVCACISVCVRDTKQQQQGEAMSTDSWLNEPLGQPLGLGTIPPAGLARDRHLLALGRPSKQRGVGIYVRGNTPQCRRHVTVFFSRAIWSSHTHMVPVMPANGPTQFTMPGGTLYGISPSESEASSSAASYEAMSSRGFGHSPLCGGRRK